MKNLVGMLFVIIIMLTSCKKDEMPAPVNTDAIKAQLSAIALPDKEVVQTYLSGTSLKSTADENPEITLVEVFQLKEETYDVYFDACVKKLIYYEINAGGNRVKLLTINQQFQIRDGKVDTTTFSLDYEVGCPYGKYFGLKTWNNLNQITYYFRFSDGRQFAYYGGETNSSTIYLPPIDGGEWQLKLTYDNGDMRQEFLTNMIDFYAQPYLLELQLQIKKENTVSIIEMDNSSIKGAYLLQLRGEDEDGNYFYFDCPVSYNEELPEIISFYAPFDVKRFYVCGINGCWAMSTKYLDHYMKNGIIIYQFH